MTSGLGDQLAQAFKHGHAAGMSTADSLRQDSGGSYTKAEVNYRKCDDGSDECCDNCKHFDGTSKCDLVSGKISGSMVCDKFEAAQSQPSADTNQSASQPVTE